MEVSLSFCCLFVCLPYFVFCNASFSSNRKTALFFHTARCKLVVSLFCVFSVPISLLFWLSIIHFFLLSVVSMRFFSFVVVLLHIIHKSFLHTVSSCALVHLCIFSSPSERILSFSVRASPSFPAPAAGASAEFHFSLSWFQTARPLVLRIRKYRSICFT